MEFNKRIAARYPELFNQDDQEDEESDRFLIDPVKLFGKKWGSYGELFALAQGDIRRFEEIVGLPLQQCLMYLAYLKDKNDVEVQMVRKNQIK